MDSVFCITVFTLSAEFKCISLDWCTQEDEFLVCTFKQDDHDRHGEENDGIIIHQNDDTINFPQGDLHAACYAMYFWATDNPDDERVPFSEPFSSLIAWPGWPQPDREWHRSSPTTSVPPKRIKAKDPSWHVLVGKEARMFTVVWLPLLFLSLSHRPALEQVNKTWPQSLVLHRSTLYWLNKRPRRKATRHSQLALSPPAWA